MKRIMLAVIAVLTMSAGARAEETAASCAATATADNPFVYTSGNFSAGIVSGDVLAGYDIFKHVSDINARGGGSLTLVQYGRLGVYLGALTPSNEPQAVAVVAGPSVSLDDVMKKAMTGMLTVLPFKIDSGTAEAIASAFTLKVYYGRDFRYNGDIGGVAFGIKKVF